MGISAEEIARFERLLSDRLGLQADPGNRAPIVEALAERARGGTAADVLARLEAPATARAELRAIAALVTVGESYFFRGRDHLRAFSDVCLPERLKVPGRPIRILSAGCSSGEEPYTLAMILQDAGAEAAVTGIDVNPEQLAKAGRAVYTPWSLRELPAGDRARWFEPAGRDHRLKDDLRGLVRFEERNLLEDDRTFWKAGAFDVIFCRNVLIYLTPSAIQEVITRFQRALVPGGYLFLGHSETLRGVTQRFRLCSSHDTFYYQEGGAAPATAEKPVDWAGSIERSSRRIIDLAAPAAAKTEAPAQGLDEALELFRRERWAEAAARLRALPPSAEASRALAAALVSLGDAGEAGRVCEELLAAGDHCADARYLEALVREQTGDLPGAAARARVAGDLDRSFAMPHLLLGRVCRRQGDAAGAQRAYEQALALLAAEDAGRVLLYGGGFGRDVLMNVCQGELSGRGARR